MHSRAPKWRDRPCTPAQREENGLIYIRELYRLTRLGNLRLVAGEQGLGRRVTAAVLFEYDPSRMLLADFYRGDLVVTTLAYARGDEELVGRTLTTLMNQGVAGLLIKTAYFARLPEPVLAMANRLGTPIFLFDDTYIEEVILDVTELIRGSRHFSGHEREIEALIAMPAGEPALALAARLDPIGAKRYAVAALMPKERLLSLEDRLYNALYGSDDLAQRFGVAAWQRMLFVLCRLSDGEQTSGVDMLLRRAKADDDGLFVGESEPCTPDALGVALCEARYAALAAQLTGVRQLSGVQLGLWAYLLPMRENAFVRTRCAQNLRRIREYDEQNRASLLMTARAYVDGHMQIAAAARALYQHPNTVRYRLARIKELLGADSDEALDLMLLLSLGLERADPAQT